MTDRGILFSGPMVRALLDGRKTMTRRLLPRAYRHLVTREHTLNRIYRAPMGPLQCAFKDLDGRVVSFPIGYEPGDRLWVRETWCDPENDRQPIYKADLTETEAIEVDRVNRICRGLRKIARPWRSPIHMPRWTSRLTLVVTAVKIERLQDISEEDAQAEGICRSDPTPEDLANGCTEQDFVFLAPGTRQGWGMTKEERNRPQWGPTAAFAFRCLWESLHGKGAWDANPEVVAMTFRVYKANIDRMEAA